jgi:hypothetical protein
MAVQPSDLKKQLEESNILFFEQLEREIDIHLRAAYRGGVVYFPFDLHVNDEVREMLRLAYVGWRLEFKTSDSGSCIKFTPLDEGMSGVAMYQAAAKAMSKAARGKR